MPQIAAWRVESRSRESLSFATSVSHPLLGDAHVIEHAGRVDHRDDGDRLGSIPTQIPAIAEPGRAAAGTGGALLNEIAARAHARPAALRRARIRRPALYRALLRSFRASADEATFTKDRADARRDARPRRDRRSTSRPRRTRASRMRTASCELRDGLERAVIDGVAYEREGSPARLVDETCTPRSGSAMTVVGARRDVRRRRRARRRPAPASARTTSDVIGKPFPPALLARARRPRQRARPARACPSSCRASLWADLGARAARATPDGYEVHAALWERLAPHGMARLAMALAEALAPVVTMKLVHQLGKPR